MNKILKSGVMAFAGVAALAMTACVDDYDYTPSKDETGEQVYFSSNLGTKFDVDLNGNELSIPVNRENRSAAANITVEITSTSGNGKLFTFPASQLSYNAGDSVAYLKFGYNASAMELGKYDTITVKIADEVNTTNYGSSSYTFVAGASAYRDMAEMGTMRDGIIAPLYGLTVATYPVKVQENVVEPGKYRIVNPFGNQANNAWPYAQDGEYDNSTDHYIEIDATDPDYVYIIGGATGRTFSSEGEIWVTSYVDYFMQGGNSLEAVKQNAPELFGKMVDGVVTMPGQATAPNYKGSLLFGFNGTYSYVNNSDQFAFALPGHQITDYSMSFTQKGVYTDVNGNSYVDGTFTLGNDITSMKYTITNDESKVDELYKGMILNQVDPLGEVTESGDVRIPVSKSGKYYIVMAGYNGVDVAGESTSEIEVNLGGNEKETYEAIAAGSLHVCYEDVSGKIWTDENDKPSTSFITPFDVEAQLMQSTDDPTKFCVSPYLGDANSPLEFTLDADGYITVEPQNSHVQIRVGETETMDLYYADLYTMAGIDTQTFGTDFQSIVAKNNLRSYYDSKDDIYYFTINFMGLQNGQYAYFGATQIEAFEILDRNDAAVQKAVAKAKAAAAVKKYVYRANNKPAHFSVNRNFSSLKK